MELSVLEIALAIIIVAIGTSIQAAIGFGLAMIAAPLLILVDRAFVPAPLIAAALVLVICMAYKDRAAIDLGNFKVALLGRVIGTPPAAWLLGTVSAASFDILFAVLVLLAVGVSLIHANIKATPMNVFLATIASGFMSTISSIGGPPIALVYQNAKGPELRANLSVLFILGCSISLGALFIIGKFTFSDLAYAGVLILGVVLGLLISGPVKRFVDQSTARPYLLGLCFISASLVLLRALLNIYA
ncbi:sulfite exporter TauE/SafE family protein [Gammaproteobacteria bacterium]|nr:sulfite exporter TauE/SafE family protein [Gammaproteobacteria bacterium]